VIAKQSVQQFLIEKAGGGRHEAAITAGPNHSIIGMTGRQSNRLEISIAGEGSPQIILQLFRSPSHSNCLVRKPRNNCISASSGYRGNDHPTSDRTPYMRHSPESLNVANQSRDFGKLWEAARYLPARF
jgi:hypothetical protein